jgi:hypothetical protein
MEWFFVSLHLLAYLAGVSEIDEKRVAGRIGRIEEKINNNTAGIQREK